jgi:flagellar biosynthesis/type III secretory pathway M-ring protein FliF/YscJ
MTLAQEVSHPEWLNYLLAAVPWIVIFLVVWPVCFFLLRRANRRRVELEAAKGEAEALRAELDRRSSSRVGGGEDSAR